MLTSDFHSQDNLQTIAAGKDTGFVELGITGRKDICAGASAGLGYATARLGP